MQWFDVDGCYIFMKSETFSTSFVYITDERKTENLDKDSKSRELR